MATMVYAPQMTVGQVYARNVAIAGEPLRPVGNVSKLEVSFEEEVIRQPDYTKPGGGTYASVRRVTQSSLATTWHDFNLNNLALALYGSTTSVTGTTVTDEAVTGRKGSLIPLAKPNPTAVSISKAATPTVMLVAGTDYEVRAEGIWIPETGSAIDTSGTGEALLVDYSYPNHGLVQALTSGAKVLQLRFGGLNEADSNKPVIVDIWRVLLSPVSTLSLIGDGFGALELSGDLNKDATRGLGISAYMQITKVE